MPQVKSSNPYVRIVKRKSGPNEENSFASVRAKDGSWLWTLVDRSIVQDWDQVVIGLSIYKVSRQEIKDSAELFISLSLS